MIEYSANIVPQQEIAHHLNMLAQQRWELKQALNIGGQFNHVILILAREKDEVLQG